MPSTARPPTTARPAGGGDTGPAILSEPARAAIASAALALRWGAVGYGIAVVAPMGARNTIADVVALGICVFLTTLRTLAPLRLGAGTISTRGAALVDVALFSLAAGATGAGGSPWVWCAIAAIALAALGWGAGLALVAGVVALVSLVAGVLVVGDPLGVLWASETDLLAASAAVVAATVAVFMRHRLAEAEARATHARGELDDLRDANRLLGELSELALTLPGAFTLREALQRIRGQVRTYLDPRVTVLVTFDEHSDEWTPKLADGCALRSAYHRSELPEPLLMALGDDDVVARPRLAAGDGRLDESSGSGLYLPLRARDRVVGLLGVEHPDPGHFDAVDPVLRDGLADVIGLTVDNARWFGRLRSLGAEEERIRVARDIHDRLGQWMTYIKLELEQLAAADTISHESVERLHDDAAEALDELRETLRQLRSGVSDERPLAVLGRDLVTRFADRTDVAARFTVADPDRRLPVPVENELLRILQEALNNVDRHAKAHHVEVTWTVEGGNFELVVRDDGQGFDPERAVREHSYGIVGMRERAEVVGANLRVTSAPGEGTTVVVAAGRVGPAARAKYPGDRRGADTDTAEVTMRDGGDAGAQTLDQNSGDKRGRT